MASLPISPALHLGAGEFSGVTDLAVSLGEAGVYARLREMVCRGIRAVPVGHQQMVEALFIYMSE